MCTLVDCRACAGMDRELSSIEEIRSSGRERERERERDGRYLPVGSR